MPNKPTDLIPCEKCTDAIKGNCETALIIDSDGVRCHHDAPTNPPEASAQKPEAERFTAEALRKQWINHLNSYACYGPRPCLVCAVYLQHEATERDGRPCDMERIAELKEHVEKLLKSELNRIIYQEISDVVIDDLKRKQADLLKRVEEAEHDRQSLRNFHDASMVELSRLLGIDGGAEENQFKWVALAVSSTMRDADSLRTAVSRLEGELEKLRGGQQTHAENFHNWGWRHYDRLGRKYSALTAQLAEAEAEAHRLDLMLEKDFDKYESECRLASWQLATKRGDSLAEYNTVLTAQMSIAMKYFNLMVCPSKSIPHHLHCTFSVACTNSRDALRQMDEISTPPAPASEGKEASHD